MSIADTLKNSYLRIDARSLGLFRVAMGLALLGDWCTRWHDSKAFYSNEGALANHAHLFYTIRQSPPLPVWSLFHAVSSPGEAAVGLLVVLVIYLLFLIGHKTRVFHVLSLVMLVSLTGRNVLIEGPATCAAISILAVTAFLPCGSRFSLDSLRESFRRRREKDATDLNDRAPPTEQALSAERSPGWTPTSLAALVVLLQIAILFYAVVRQQSGGAWHDGTALHYALWVERWVSDLGIHLRAAPPGLLKVWSYTLRYTPFAVPILVLAPAPRFTRPAAFGLMLFYGVSYGLLFSFALWGWTIAAASFLVLSTENWDRALSSFRKGRALTVIYDADCGICLWIARLLRRMDLRGHLTFQGNDALSVAPGQKPPYRSPAGEEEAEERVLHRRSAPGAKVTTSPLPAAVTDDLVASTVVAVDEKGAVFTEGAAVAEIVRSLPLGAILSIPFRIPGLTAVWNALYRYVAPRRMAISASVGLAECGVPAPKDEGSSDEESNEPAPVAPFVQTVRTVTGVVREGGSVILFAALLAQTAKSNPWPSALTVPQIPAFAMITGFSRMQARYDVLAPEPPAEDGVLVIDAQTGAGKSIDPLTGAEPSFDVPRFRMGPYWSAFSSAIRAKVSPDFERSFRDYVVKGGPAWQTDTPDNRISGLDAYWLVYKSPAPGGAAAEITGKEKLFTFSRGGHGGGAIPILKGPLVR